MSVNIQECQECGEFDGRHRATEHRVVLGCPMRDTSQIIAERTSLQAIVSALDTELDKRMVKCPTCRCRVLPGAKCACCAEPALSDDEPVV